MAAQQQPTAKLDVSLEAPFVKVVQECIVKSKEYSD